jgi:hypothetical protein
MATTNIKSEIRFLAGPQSRWQEFKFTIKVLLDSGRCILRGPVLPYLAQHGLKKGIRITKLPKNWPAK